MFVPSPRPPPIFYRQRNTSALGYLHYSAGRVASHLHDAVPRRNSYRSSSTITLLARLKLRHEHLLFSRKINSPFVGPLKLTQMLCPARD